MAVRVIRRPMPNPILLPAEQFPGRVARMLGDLAEDDQPHRGRPPGEVEHARPGGRGERPVFRQSLRRAGGDGIKLELLFGDEAIRRAGELAIVDVVADQFVQRPAVQGFVVGFVGQQVVGAQTVQAIGQRHRRWGPFGRLFDDHHVQQLTLQGQFLFQFHLPRGIPEQVGEGDAKQAMPLPNAIGGHERAPRRHRHSNRPRDGRQNRAGPPGGVRGRNHPRAPVRASAYRPDQIAARSIQPSSSRAKAVSHRAPPSASRRSDVE